MILEGALSEFADRGRRERDVAAVIARLGLSAVAIRSIINDGVLGSAFAGKRQTRNSDGDVQYELDVHADELFMSAMHKAPVSFYATEELERPVRLQRDMKLALAIDPLDGSSNIDTNVSIGTIFSILPAIDDDDDIAASFKQPGSAQLAAGFFIYGPQLALAVTWGEGLHIFAYSARKEAFIRVCEALSISRKAHEFAINASNARHWDEPVRAYVDDCLKGNAGPREKDYNMRWIASLVADCYRILVRGGVFLYPSDSRPGYGRGRLRLVYEANPIAMIVEQASGVAIDGQTRILDLVPGELHQRTPMIFGSGDEVERIARYYASSGSIGERAPLFGTRGLYRA